MGGDSEFEDYLISVLMQTKIFTSDPNHPYYEDPNDPSYDPNNTSIKKITEIFGSRGISQSPSTPSGIVAVAGDTVIHLRWRENPDIDNVAGYYVFFRTENDVVTNNTDPSVQRDAGLTTEYTLEGLTNGTTYVAFLRAYNKYETKSDESDMIYATPSEQIDTDTSETTEKTTLCFINLLQ